MPSRALAHRPHRASGAWPASQARGRWGRGSEEGGCVPPAPSILSHISVIKNLHYMSGDTEWLYVTEDCLVLALREFVIDNLCN